MSSFQHSFNIAGPMLGGIAVGQRQQELAQDEQRFLAHQMLQQQIMARQEAERQQSLFQERSARTYNMGRMRSMMGEDPALSGAMSQTMDAFSNMPADMQGGELDRIGKQQRQQQMKAQRDARAYPFFESLRREGFTKEAARRQALYEAQDPESLKGTSLEHLFEEYTPPVPPAPAVPPFDPKAYAQQLMQSAPPRGWAPPMQMAPGQGTMGGIDPVAAQRLATLAQVSGQRPSAVQAERMMYPKQNQRIEEEAPDPEALTDNMMALYPDKPREEVLSWVTARLAKLPVPATKLGVAKTAPDPQVKVSAEQAVIDAEEEVRSLQEELKEIKALRQDAEAGAAIPGYANPDQAVSERRTRLARAHQKLADAKKRREEAKAGIGEPSTEAAAGKFTPSPQGKASPKTPHDEGELEDGGEDEDAMVRRMLGEGVSDDEIDAAITRRRKGR